MTAIDWPIVLSNIERSANVVAAPGCVVLFAVRVRWTVWYIGGVRECCSRLEKCSEGRFSGWVLSGLLSVSGSEQGVLDRQYRLYRQRSYEVSGAD